MLVRGDGDVVDDGATTLGDSGVASGGRAEEGEWTAVDEDDGTVEGSRLPGNVSGNVSGMEPDGD